MEYFISAGLALLGVVISVFSSQYVARKQIKLEIDKNRTLQSQIELSLLEMYERKIIDKRIELYPELYYVLSSTAKTMKQDGVNDKLSQELLKAVELWDSKYALFFSLDTVKCCSEFRSFMRQRDFTSDDEAIRSELLTKIGEFENCLKSDIGVWGIAGNNYPKKKIISRYEEYFEGD